MHYTTRWDVEAVRQGIVDDRQRGLKIREIQANHNCSKHMVYRWLRRASLASNSSRPHRQPRRSPKEIEERVVAARQALHLGPDMLGATLGMAGSTVYKILKRHGLNRLTTKAPRSTVRYEKDAPGALVHIDVKKLGRLGLCDDPQLRRRFPGNECLHIAIDDYSRVGFQEIHPNELATTAGGFLERMVAWYASIGVQVQAVMTDRGACYTSAYFADVCRLLDARHILIRPRRPQTNGKVERLIRTVSDEALKGRSYGSLEARAAALHNHMHFYNTRRPHTAIGGKTPFQRLVEKRTPGVWGVH